MTTTKRRRSDSRVFQQSLQLVRPHNDALIGTARCKLLAISRVRHTVNGVSMSGQTLDERPFVRFVHEHLIAGTDNQLRAIRIEANRMNAGNIYKIISQKCPIQS